LQDVNLCYLLMIVLQSINHQNESKKMKTINGIKYTADELHVADALGKARVCMASELTVGHGRWIQRLDGETAFSTEIYAEFIKSGRGAYPKFVCEYVKKHPRAQKVIYSTNTRLLNQILKFTRRHYLELSI
jgi:hypothetical protein